MNIASKIILKVSTLGSLLFISSNAFAGSVGSIPMTLNGATAVPTLGSSMLIVLCLLLFAVAFKVAKQKNASKMFVTLLGVTALSSGVGGVKLVSDSYATGQTHYQSGYNIGETVNVPLIPNDNYIQNDHSTPMTIGHINSLPPYQCFANIGRADIACTTGASLAPGQSCSVRCLDGSQSQN